MGRLTCIILTLTLFPVVLFAQQGQVSGDSSEDNLSNYISGRVGGLTFRQPSGAPGAYTFLQVRNFGAPLYVIDGVICTVEEFNDLDLSSVEEIKVLDDAESSTFGRQGACGVIMVKTRTSSGGRTSVKADVRYGLRQYTFVPDPMSEFQTEYAHAMALVNTGAVSEPEDLARLRLSIEDLYLNKEGAVKYSPASSGHVSVNVSGGSRKFSYDADLNMLAQQGLSGVSGRIRTGVRASFRSEITDRLSLSYTFIGNIVYPGQYNSMRNRLSIRYDLPVEGLSISALGAYNAAMPNGGSIFARRHDSDVQATISYDRRFNLWYISASADAQNLSFSTDGAKTGLWGISARAGVDYDSRYVLCATVRSDVSKQLGNIILPYAKFTWNFAEEPFYRDSRAHDAMNQLSLSASYGRVDTDSQIAEAALKAGFLDSRITLGAEVFLRTGAYATPGLDVNATFSGRQTGKVRWQLAANLTFTRHLDNLTYGGTYGYDNYWNSGSLFSPDIWMYQVLSVFRNQKQINEYSVNIDGQNNTTLLPGDLVIKDWNQDGVINAYDLRPVGYSGSPNTDGQTTNPCINAGLNFSLAAGGFDMSVCLAGGFLNTWTPGWLGEAEPSHAVTTIDVWHRQNIFDPQSEWVAGTFPAYRGAVSEKNALNDFYNMNVNYVRLKEVTAGYTFRAGKGAIRVYLSGINLLTADNLSGKYGVDPESSPCPAPGQLPCKSINIGMNLKF